jgi:Mor family transcriptional regulator
MHEAHPIAKAIGIEAAQALQAVFIGEEVTFPMLTALHRQQRDIAIRADHDKGLTVNALAQKHRVSSRSIYLSLRRTKQPIATPKPRGRK